MTSSATEPTTPRDRERRTRIDPYLFLVLEGGRPRASGMRIALDRADVVKIGRRDARTLTRASKEASLTVPDARMSSEHARIVRIDRGFAIEDAGSTNGTIVEGEPLAAGERRSLHDGDVVEIGQTVFVYRELESDAAASSGDLDAHTMTGPSGLRTLSPELARMFELLARTAASPLSLLLLGETGTGKEVTARAIHELSRRPGPFVAVHCGAIPAHLVEAHLFGHVRGSFSGAVRDEPGLVRAAQYGTLLLDEVGDLPAASQAALLRVIQEREVVPVGASQPIKVDVRVIAATHQPLEALIEQRAFRRDLYARIAGYVVTLAPLRDRIVDLGLLAASMIASGTVAAPPELRLHREAIRAMLQHDWPMNVRELSQSLGAAIALADEGVVTRDVLPEPLRTESLHHAPEPSGGEDEARKAELIARFAEAKGNVSEVARAMGKARQQVQRWMRRYGIDAERYR